MAASLILIITWLIKEIAEHNDCGLDAFVNRRTLELFFIPSENNFAYSDVEELYSEDLRKIKENLHQIFKIERLRLNDSYGESHSFTSSAMQSIIR